MSQADSLVEKKSAVFREVYSIAEPNVYAAVVRDPMTHKMRYEVIEPTLLQEEQKYLDEIKALLSSGFQRKLLKNSCTT